ncbi:unnamed protein product, partial [Ectocarpus sp. 12 AP-2014]
MHGNGERCAVDGLAWSCVSLKLLDMLGKTGASSNLTLLRCTLVCRKIELRECANGGERKLTRTMCAICVQVRKGMWMMPSGTRLSCRRKYSGKRVVHAGRLVTRVAQTTPSSP